MYHVTKSSHTTYVHIYIVQYVLGSVAVSFLTSVYTHLYVARVLVRMYVSSKSNYDPSTLCAPALTVLLSLAS